VGKGHLPAGREALKRNETQIVIKQKDKKEPEPQTEQSEPVSNVGSDYPYGQAEQAIEERDASE
jgi:hypothetical protein